MRRPERDQPLVGQRILVVDDEVMIAIDLEQTLRDAGAEIVSASTLREALRAAEDAPLSAAILDVHLGRQTTEAVAELLTRRKLPFVFHSGNQLPTAMRAKFPAAAVMIKPMRPEAIVTALLTAMPHAR